MDQQISSNLPNDDTLFDRVNNIDVLVEKASQEENLEKACDLLIQAVELNQQLKPNPETP